MTAGDPVTHWEAQLRKVIGMDEAEIAHHLDALQWFCAAHAVTPAGLLAGWESYDELTVRRRRADAPPHRAVESFLIHNGVNIFGDLICVPRTEADLREQWGSRR